MMGTTDITHVVLPSLRELTPTSALLVLLLVVACWLGVVRSNPLSKVPSLHWSSPFARYYLLYHTRFTSRSKRTYRAHLAGRDAFSPVVRVAPNEVSVMSCRAVMNVYGESWAKSKHYSNFANYNGTDHIFSFSDRRLHDERKRILGPGLSRTSVGNVHMESLVRNRAAEIGNFLRNQTANGRPTGALLVRNIFRALSTDCTTAAFFSERWGTTFCRDLRADANTLTEMGMDELRIWCEDTRESSFFFLREPEFHWMMRFVPSQCADEQSQMENFITRLVQRYEAAKQEKVVSRTSEIDVAEHKTLYDRMWDWQSPNNGSRLTWRDRASQAMDMIGAAVDAIACTLEALVEEMAQRPDLQQRLRQELWDNLPATSECMTYAMVDRLPLLNAVVLEALRLVDTITSYQPRIVPQGGRTVEGYYLPAGTIVSTHPYLMNRHPDVFPNPHVFDPDRWLVSKEELALLNRGFYAWSKGNYRCPSVDYSTSVMKFATAEIFLNFNATTLSEEDKVWREPIDLIKAQVVFRRWEDVDATLAQAC